MLINMFNNAEQICQVDMFSTTFLIDKTKYHTARTIKRENLTVGILMFLTVGILMF